MAKAIPVSSAPEASVEVAPVVAPAVAPRKDIEVIRDEALAAGKNAFVLGNMVRVDA